LARLAAISAKCCSLGESSAARYRSSTASPLESFEGPGNEDEAVALFDAYLDRADSRHRLTQLGTGE
jgi:hypothetical protein